jgi:phenylalanyl-tRNA synthetase beta chain
VREDLAVIVPEAVSAQQVTATVRQAGGPLLQAVVVFDAYRDPERIGEGNVSLALHMEFRALDRTLTDQEVAERRRAIVEALGHELGGRVRDA